MNEKVYNLKEFKDLIEKYQSITLDEAKGAWLIDGKITAEIITGFGGRDTCTLCIAVEGYCKYCIYRDFIGCVKGDNSSSCDAIYEARDPEELIIAFKSRAAHMKTLIT